MPQLTVPTGTLTVGDFLETHGLLSARQTAKRVGLPDKTVSDWGVGNDGYGSARAKFCKHFDITEENLFEMIDAGRLATRAKQARARALRADFERSTNAKPPAKGRTKSKKGRRK